MTRAPLPAPPLREQVLAVLRRHLSTINAMAILRVAEQTAGVEAGELGLAEVSRLLGAIKGRLPVFLADPAAVAQCVSVLEALAGAERPPVSSWRTQCVRVEITSEEDVVTARTLGRRACAELGFGTGDQNKVATVISELARNIVQYAKRGAVEIHRIEGRERGIEIIAKDSGPGISNLDAVMAGRYTSKIGMGMGLRGTKNLMDEMDVRTAPGVGTTVRARKLKR